MSNLLDKILLLDSAISARREHVSKALYDAVGCCADRSARAGLLKLRRALYSVEPCGYVSLDTLALHLPADTLREVSATVADVQELFAITAEYRESYEYALEHARAVLREAVDDVDFRKGLLMSSPVLFGNVTTYKTAQSRATSRTDKVERGLLRYLTRAVMKATPFATFCAVGEVAFNAGKTSDRQRFEADPSVKTGHVRLNKTLYRLLWSHLKLRPAVRQSLEVELNPTVETHDTYYRYLAAVSGRETFQRVAHGDAIETTLSLLSSHPHASLGELAVMLATCPQVDATTEDASAYLNALVECGLVRLRAPVHEQVPDWDRPLRTALESVNDKDAKVVVGLITDLRALAEQFANADVVERERLYNAMQAALSEGVKKLQLTASFRTGFPLLYEDASTAARLMIPQAADVDAAFAALARWIEIVRPLDQTRADQAVMRHVFDSQYAPGTRVPLLSFYEVFYREHNKVHLEKRGRAQLSPDDPAVVGYDFANPLGLDVIREQREAFRRLVDVFRARWAQSSSATSVEVDADSVRSVLDPIASTATNMSGRSASTFCQLVYNPSSSPAATLVVPNGQFSVGFGKYFSRFLYMLPASTTARVVDANALLAGESILAEVSDDADFNANLHPPLLPWEIEYPTGEAPLTTKTIKCTDVVVEANPDDSHSLFLAHRLTGHRVLPVDLGFLSPRMRPPLFQLLAHFAPGMLFSAPLPDRVQAQPLSVRGDALKQADIDVLDALPASHIKHLADEELSARATATEPTISYRPRFVFDGCLVLARQRWSVPDVLVPRLLPNEGDADFLLRVHRWRCANGIPPEVYVRVVAEVKRSWPKGDTPSATSIATADTVSTNRNSESTYPEPRIEPELREEVLAAPPESGRSGSDVVNAMADPGASKADVRARGSKDLHKPQYIDFANPLLVKLFTRVAGDLPAYRLEIEERFPHENELARFGEHAYATELVVQVDFAPPASRSRAAADYSVGAAIGRETSDV